MARNLLQLMAAIVALGLLSAPALAEPKCLVEETCAGTSDNCEPAEGVVVITALDAYKATLQLNDGPVHESTYLSLNRVLALIFVVQGVEHQLRIQENGSFNYLISTPNPDAPKGKDQILYRGTCVEG